jgi:hypothetical protein
MAKLKRTPRQQMKYFQIAGLKIKARTARVAYRKYLRGNYAHDVLVRDLELDNGPGWEMPSAVIPHWKDLYRLYRSRARSKMSSA